MFSGAQWIWDRKNKEDSKSTYLRKSFEVFGKVQKATLFVCALGYGVVKINGEKITDEVLTTPFTRFDKRILYNEYDVSRLIKEGKNVIFAELGNGWRNCVGKTWEYDKAIWKGGRQMIACLEIVYSDGKSERILSGSDWKVKEGATIFNHLREGEVFDARLWDENMLSVKYDDEMWESAECWDGPGGVLEKADLPPIRETRVLKGEYLGDGIYDFGENISGYGKIRLGGEGEAGREIVLVYAERLKDGKIDSEHINKFADKTGHIDRYIVGGRAEEEWKPSFVYHGFRYIKVENAPKNFEIEAVEAHTDLKTVGSFECSDEMLCKIHNASRLATLSNYHSIPTDCPHREQNGWTGDAALSCEQALMNFDMTKAYRKWMLDFKDDQRPNGIISGIIPTMKSSGYGPAWDMAMFVIPYKVYDVTGNDELIRLMYPNMKLYMKHIASRSEGYIIRFGLGDWCNFSKSPQCPSSVLTTACYFEIAGIMARCAEILGEDGEEYEKTAKDIKAAWRAEFMSDESLEKYQAYLACGIYTGLFSKSEIPQMAKALADLVIEKDYHIDCGILGTKFIFSALSQNGYGEVLYKAVTNTTMPSYAYWVLRGATALCENWDMSGSLNHHMFSEVDNWFYKYLGGISFFNGEITVCPVFLKEIDWVRAKSRGVSVYYDKETVEITLPKRGTIIIGEKCEEKEAGTYVFKR